MKHIFRVLGFTFNYFSPFVIVYYNHARVVDGGLDVSVLGLMIVTGGVFGIFKFIEKKKRLSEIQDKNKLFIVVYSGIKKLLITFAIWWTLLTISDNIDALILTVKLFTLTFLVGFAFNLLGTKVKKE